MQRRSYFPWSYASFIRRSLSFASTRLDLSVDGLEPMPMPALESHTLALSSAPPAAPRSGKRLSLVLRAGTAAAHEAVEHATGLPDAVTDMAEYRACLSGFARVILPLERSFEGLGGWEDFGIDLAERARTPALVADLTHAGIDPDDLAPAHVPAPTDLAAGLGALYVIEGSVLGGRIILDALLGRFGQDIAGATAFFGGRGPRTGLLWQTFRAALDRFGESEPEAEAAVIAAANQTFAAFAATFQAHPIRRARP
jgi:heme oxygenase